MKVRLVLKKEFRQTMAMHGMNQEALAKATGYTPAAISMFLSGAREPSIQFLRRLAEKLGLKAENIIETVQTGKEKT